MKSLLLLCTLLLPFTSWAADTQAANDKTAAAIRTTLSNMPIKAIHTTPITGVYEVQVGDTIYYTDKTGQYLINGHMFDTHIKQDLTAKRLADINRINWKDLPLKDAIVSGPKNGLKMAVFTDPDCPYCKRLEENLKNVTGIRIYTFLFPLTQLHPDAYEKSKSIWCAKDQHQAMLDVMLNNKTLDKATCKTPIDENMKLAEKLNVHGTPTIFAEDGRKYTGGDIKTWLQQGSK
ncbi:DsbC family protein [Ghiorsea bivora]|uniref:DsbC family protein n=1 Tax=Ghiorsea bivora TaxID=1485545 RepID=UPI000571BA8B|nr:DsbC family protein [Ghiorsea bivora]